MIAAAAHCPWDKIWSNLGLASDFAPSVVVVEGRDGECLALVATRLAHYLLLLS